jgi:hypothetical protein
MIADTRRFAEVFDDHKFLVMVWGGRTVATMTE